MTNHSQSFFRGKKGNAVIDTLTVIIFLIVFGVLAILGYMVFTDVNEDLQTDPDLSDSSKQISNTLATNYPSLLDNGFMLVLILFWIFVIISSFMVESHPIFFVISFILLISIFVVVMLLSNSFQELMDDPDLTEASDHFPKINFILNNLLTIAFVFAISIILALYGKNKMGL